MSLLCQGCQPQNGDTTPARIDSWRGTPLNQHLLLISRKRRRRRRGLIKHNEEISCGGCRKDTRPKKLEKTRSIKNHLTKSCSTKFYWPPALAQENTISSWGRKQQHILIWFVSLTFDVSRRCSFERKFFFERSLNVECIKGTKFAKDGSIALHTDDEEEEESFIFSCLARLLLLLLLLPRSSKLLRGSDRGPRADDETSSDGPGPQTHGWAFAGKSGLSELKVSQ